MSPFVTRPPLPVPATAAGSTPVSSASRRTAGDLAAGAASFGWGAGSGAEAGFGAAGFSSAGGDVPAPSSMEATTWPILTSAPASTFRVMTPEASALPSDVILSVSSSKSGWSLLTASPFLTCHFARMPLLIDSPMGGILTSMGIARGCRRP